MMRIFGFKRLIFVDFFQDKQFLDSLKGQRFGMVHFLMGSVFELGFELNLFKDDFFERLPGRRFDSVGRG